MQVVVRLPGVLGVAVKVVVARVSGSTLQVSQAPAAGIAGKRFASLFAIAATAPFAMPFGSSFAQRTPSHTHSKASKSTTVSGR